MKGDPAHREFSMMLSRLISGRAKGNDKASLNRHLATSKAARNYYRFYLAVHQDLTEHVRENPGSVFPLRPAPRFPLKTLALVALIPLALALGVWWSASKTVTEKAHVPMVFADRVGRVLGVTAFSKDVRWNISKSPDVGSELSAFPVVVDRGILVMHLVGGQLLTVRGPARFELLNEREMKLDFGEVALRMVRPNETYTIRVPRGAVADLGTEFSLRVAADGTADVRVFEGSAVAYATDAGGRTRYDRELTAGQSVRITGTLEECILPEGGFLRSLGEVALVKSPAGPRYTAAVSSSRPLAWWRFEENKREVESAAPEGPPLLLHGKAKITRIDQRGFFHSDLETHQGLASVKQGIPGLDTKSGISVECLLLPLSERHMTAFMLEDLSMPWSPGQKFPPQRCQVERVGLDGTFLGHSHPPFAVRGMMRVPSGYANGVNLYSERSFFAFRWIHVVLTHDGEVARLYIDGGLVNEAPDLKPFANALLRPAVGVLRNTQDKFRRQWIGGIDEVALYGRVLKASEVTRHYESLEKNF